MATKKQSQNSVVLALVSLPPQKRLPRGHILMAMLEKNSDGKVVAVRGTRRSYTDETFATEWNITLNRLVLKSIELTASGVKVEVVSFVDTTANYGKTVNEWKSGRIEEALTYLKEHHKKEESEDNLPF